MPKSSMAGKVWSYEVLRVIHAHRPLHRVLDIGAGLGMYSQFRQPGQHWTAVEVWGPFIEAYELAKKYDKVIVGDMRFMDWRHFAPLDLVICGDVLEHMTKDEALQILHHGLNNSRIVMVSIPIIPSEQGARWGNPYEEHVKPDWTHEECIESFPCICIGIQQDGIGVYILTRSGEDFEALQSIVSGKLKAPLAPNEPIRKLVMSSAAHPSLPS